MNSIIRTSRTRRSAQFPHAAKQSSMRPIQPLTKRITDLIPHVVMACSLIGASQARAATVAWTGTGAGDGWATSGNWTGGVIPGTTSGTTNGDFAFFNATSGTNHVTVDSGRNLAGLLFGGGTTLNYTIGDNAGNALLLSNGGYIYVGGNGINNPGANGMVFTVAAPLVIEGANASYTFANWANNAVNPRLVLSGSITAAASSGTTTIRLDGGNGVNAITGAISDGVLGAKMALNEVSTTGNWTLSGANTFTGPVTVYGALKLTGSSGSLSSGLFNLNAGVFTVDNTSAAGGALNNRFSAGSSANFNFSGGAFVYKGSDAAATNSTETTGTLNLLSNASTFTLTYGGTNTVTMNAAAFNRSAGQSTLLVNGLGLGKDSTSTTSVSRLFLGSAPALAGNTPALDSGNGTDGLGTGAAQDTQIVPFLVGEATVSSGGFGTATGNANTFLTYDAVTGLRPLNPVNEFVNNSIVSGTGLGNNTYIRTATTGSTNATINSLVINGGNLSIADGATLTNSSGALLFASSNSVNLSGTVGTGVLDFGSAEGIASVNTGVTGTIATGITGSGGFTKAGAGTLVFTNGPIYTGTTSVSAGTLQIGNGGSAGALSSGPVAVANGANLTLNRTDNYGGALSPVIVNSGTVNLLNGTLNFSGTISRPGATGNLNVAVNTGNRAVFNLTGGSVSSCLTLGSSGIGVVNQSGGLFTNTAESYIAQNSDGYGMYNLTSGTLNFQSYLQVGADGTGLFYQSGGSVSGPTVDFPRSGGTGVLYLTSGTFSPSNISYSWAGNTGRGEVNVAGGLLSASGGINFSNATPSTGILNLDGGTLQTNSISASSTGASRVNFNGGTLRATATSGTLLGGLTSAVVNSGGAVVDTNGNNTTITQALLAPTGSGVSSISISGTGYSGAPYVKITGDGTGATAVAAIDGSGNITGITITNPGVGYTTGTVTLVGGGGAGVSGTTVMFSTNTSGGFTKNGAGTLTLSGSNTYTGATTINSGTLQVPIPAALASSTAVVVNNAASTLAVNYGGASDYTDAQLTALLAKSTFGSSTVLGIDTSNLSGTYGGVIGIAGGLTTLGTNSLTLTGTNTYTGATAINSGTLQIGGNGSLGGGNYAGAISNAGALVFNSTANQTLSGSISGAGTLTQSGTGTLILAGSGNYTGATTINAGTVQIGDGTTGTILTSNTVTINSGGTLAINLANSGTFANAISMYVYQNPVATVNAVSSGTTTLSGNIAGTVYTTFNQNGTGTTILSGNNTYFGPTNINAGVLQLNNQYAATYSTVNVNVSNGLVFGVTAATVGGISGSGNVSLLSGTSAVTFTVGSNNNNSVYSGSFSGGGILTKTGTGALTLTGSNSILSQVNINAGTINSSGVITSGSNTGMLYVAQTAGNLGTLNVTGGSVGGVTLRIGDSGTGVLNQSGGSVISNGPNEFFLGSGGYGAYNLTSGTLASTNWFQIGGNGTGIFNQTGGVLNYTGPGIQVPRYGTGRGVIYLNGGVLNSTANINFGWDGGSPRGEVTVASGTLTVPNLIFNATGETGILNLDGGLAAVNGIYKSGTATTGIVNFNGGTLRTTYNGGNYLGTGASAVNAAYVYSGGAIIDTSGNSNTFYQPLLAPTGSSVSSISVTGTGYTGAPYVQITGDGTGATGVANIDANGNITGIVITNPGVGYTSGTVTLVGGGGTATTGTVNLTANTSGGLTKLGLGTLTLTGTNTYTGATTVSAGSLVLGNTNAYTGITTIAPNASLTLNFSAGTAAQTNIVNPASALALGGTLALTGSASATNSQTFNGSSILPGASSVVLTASTSNPLALNLGGITRNTGGTVNFTLPTGTQSASNGVLTTATNVLFTGGANTILGGWATVGGTTWAVAGTSGANTNISGLTTFSSTFASGTDVDLGAVTATPAAMTINSLRFNTAGAATVNLNGALTIATGGILETATVGNNAVAINNSTITSGNGQDLVVIQNNTSNSLTIASQIIGNIGLTKAGAGSLALSASNTFNGVVNLTAGNLYIQNSFNLGTGGAGSLVFNGGTLVYNVFGNAGSFSQDVSSKIAPVGAGQYAAINTNSATVTFNSAIGGTGGLEKLGAGYLALTATNTYTGPTWIAGGYIDFSSLSNFGNGGSGGLKFQYGGLRWRNGSTADISSLPLSYSGDTYLDTNGNNVVFNNAIAAGSIAWTFKDGLGTLDLQNTYGNAAGFIERGGTVNIDFAGASAPATNILSNGTELRFNGGRVLITGKPGATNSETFGYWNFGLHGTGAATLQFAQNGAATLNATLGTMNSRSVGNTLNIIPPTTGTLTYTGGAANTILVSSGVPYATVNGGDWAASNAANNAIVGLSSVGGYTNSTASALSGNADVAAGTDTTLAASGTVTTLRFNQNQARTITLGAATSLSTGGILVTPSVATAGSTITGGTLTASNNSGQDLVVFQNSPQPFTIASTIANINGANGLTKSGTGNLILTGNNTYTGATNVNEGTLTLTGTRTGTTASPAINVNGGALAVTGGLLNTAGNAINVGGVASAIGSFNLSGGTFFSAANLAVGNAQSAQGIINQSGGNLIGYNSLYLGWSAGSFGALNLSGGHFTLGPGYPEVRIGGGGFGMLNISGGVMNLVNGVFMNPSRTPGANYSAFVLSGSGVFNAGNGVNEVWGKNGGNVIVTVKDNAWFNEVNQPLFLGYNGGSGILNLAGGVTSLNYVQGSTNDAQNSSFVNFNGGILQATNASNLIYSITANTVYGGGAIIDTMVFGNNATVSQALLAPTGNGIGSLTLTGNTTGFLTAPIVQITGGGGSGASAIANIDASGNLTGFTIVSPGSGYTSTPTVTLVGGGVTLPTVAASLSSNTGTGGGLTKLGQGSLTLSASNNYTGTTTVTNGSLIFAPSGNVTQSFGALAFNGGDGTVQSTFNSGSNALTFSSLAARPAGATRTFIVSGGTPTGATPTNKIVLTGQAAGFIDQGTFYGTSTGSNYAWYDGTNNYVRGINYGTDAGSSTSGAATSLSGTYVQSTGAVSAQASGTFATLNISGNNGPFTLANGATLTVNGILKTGNNGTYSITGGNGIQASANTELVVRADQSGDVLQISSSILANGTNALTKTGAGQLWLSGSNTYTGPTNLAGGILTIDTPYALGSGAISFKGGTLQYNAAFAGPVPDLSARFSAIGANLNAVVDTNGFNATYASPIAGPGSFQKNGAGMLTLSGSNTFGDLNLVGGMVNFANLNNLGTGRIVFNGGGLQYAAGNTADISTRNVWLYGAATIDTNGNNVTFANPVGATGNGALTKIGAGTLRLTANNVWQGATYVNAGTLQLDFSAVPGANQTTLLSSNSVLTLAGGTLLLTGAPNATNSQTVNGANFNAGASAIQLNANASSNPLLLTLGAFTRATAGTLDITLPAGTQGSTNGVTTTSTTFVGNNVLVSAASNGIAFATIGGGDWASLTGNNIIKLASYDTNDFSAGTKNTDITSAQAPAVFSNNTLRFSGAGAASALTLASGTSVVNTGGILVTSAATGATLGGSGSIAPGAGKELVIISNGALTVNVPIANNSAGASALTLAGSGTTTLNGNNTYTGATVIDNGTVILGGSNALGAALSVNGGALQIGVNSPYAIPAASTLTVNGGVFDLNGNSFTTTSLGVGNASGVITDNSAVSGTTVLTINTTAPALATPIKDGANGRVVAVNISNNLGSGSFAANSTFSGGVTLVGGVNTRFDYSGAGVGSPGAIVSSPLGRGTLTIGLSGTDHAQLFVTLGGSTILNNIVFNSSVGTDVSSALRVGGNNVVFAGTLTAGLADINLGEGNGPGSATLQGQLTGTNGLWIKNAYSSSLAVTLNNISGTPNDYQGNTTVDSRHTLILGAADQIPDGSGKGNMALSGSFNLNGFNETINGLNGSGVVDGGSGTPVFTIGNANTTGTFSGAIKNTAGALSLVKTGAGTLTLTGSLTYSGDTTINSGTLQLGSTLNNSSVNLNGGSLSFGAQTAPAIGGLKGSGNLALSNTASAAVALTVGGNNQNTTYSGSLSGSGSLVKVGTGSLSLSGPNTYTGNTLITAGTLTLGHASALQASVLDTSGAGSLSFGALTSATFGGITGGGSLALTNSSAQPVTLSVGGNNQNATLSATLTGAGNLVKTGSGALFIVAPATYAGATVVDGGILELAGQPGDAVIHYDFNSASVSGTTLANLATTQDAAGNSGASFNGKIGSTVSFASGKGGNAAVFSGAGTSVIQTSGSVSLGTSFTYSTWLSGTVAQAGYTRIISNGYSAGGYLGTGSTGTSGYLGIVNGSNFGAASSQRPDTSGTWHMLTEVVTPTTMTLYYDATSLGSWTVSSAARNAVIGFGNGVSDVGTGWSGKMDEAYVFNRALSAAEIAGLAGGTLAATNLLPTTTDVQIATSGTLDLGGVSQQIASLGDRNGAGGLVTNSGRTPVTLAIGGTASTTFSGAIQDGASGIALTLNGNGTLILRGSNSYTGSTTINNGTLQIGNGGATGSLSPSSAIVDNAALAFNRSNTVTQSTDFASTISGSGTVVQAGSGLLVLSGSNSHSGGTTVSSGSLQVGNANALGTGGLTVNGGTLDLNGTNATAGALGGSGGSITNTVSGTATLTTSVSGTSTYAGSIQDGAGGVALTKTGTGNLILSGSISMSGLTAGRGQVALTHSGSIGALNIYTGANVTLAANTSGTRTVLSISSLALGGTFEGLSTPANSAAAMNADVIQPATATASLSTAGASASASEPASPEAVPEPATWSLLLTGALGMLGIRRKKNAGDRE